MGSTGWIIPVAVLSSICVVALAFVWWYIPRAWNKGVRADMARIDANRAERAARAARQAEQDEMADLEAGDAGAGKEAQVVETQKKGFKYAPPAYTVY